MVNRICPKCKRKVSLTQMQWDLGAELPLDCPWYNKSTAEKEEKTREYFPEESKNQYHSWLKKGT